MQCNKMFHTFDRATWGQAFLVFVVLAPAIPVLISTCSPCQPSENVSMIVRLV